jgi:glutamate racemase
MRKIGVFDSGVGGLSVVYALQEAVTDVEIIFKNDTKNVPYGDKSPKLLLKLVLPILTELIDEGCETIVIACNTVTTTLIEDLRKQIKVPLIGMEPMIKPASNMSKTKTIAVCATPTTLSSNRYKWLKEEYAKGVKVLEPDCSNWSYMIETNQIDRQKIEDLVDSLCEQNADVIVLGCTHYHWIEDIIRETAGEKVKVLQPEQQVITRLKQVLSQLD